MTSPLFRVIREEKRVEEVPDEEEPDDLTEAMFGEQGFSEPDDIESWLATAPRLLGEDLLVIQRQAKPVEAVNLWPDLVAIDREGALVIVELKQDYSGYDIYWQASVYAAAYWKRTADEIIDLYSEYRGDDRDKSVERLLEHTGSESVEDLKKKLNHRQRLVLEAHCFFESAATAVLWLKGHGLDVSCLKLTPYLGEEAEECYVRMTEFIPGPGEESLLLSLRHIPSESDDAMLNRYKYRIDKFCRSVAAKLRELLGQEALPDKVNERSKKVDGFHHFVLWYSHTPWTHDGFSFALQVRVTEKGSARFRVTVLFQFREDTARQAGITEENIEELKKFVENLADPDFNYGYESRELFGGWHEANKSLHVRLDRDGADTTARTLAKLIKDSYQKIEDLASKRRILVGSLGTLGPPPALHLLPDGKKPEDLTRTTFDFSDALDPHDWLVNDPRMLGEDLLFIQRDHFDVEGLSCDLLAVDRDGALVSVELWLCDDDFRPRRPVDWWRAFLHAAVWWKREAEDVIALYAEYLGGDRTAAVEKLKQHTGSKDEEELRTKLNRRQRALLVGRIFAKEVTTAALWLRKKHEVDVSCLQLTPYLDEETGECYVDRTDLLQEPVSEDLLSGLSITERELAEQAATLDELEGRGSQITEFSKSVARKAKARLNPELWPSEMSGSADKFFDMRFFSLWRSEPSWFWFNLFVRAPKGEHARFRVTLLFQFSKTAALKAKVGGKSISRLRGLTATFAEKVGWNARPSFGVWYEAGKTVHVALDEAGAEVAAETLAEVIREMYPRIQRVLDKDAPVGSGS